MLYEVTRPSPPPHDETVAAVAALLADGPAKSVDTELFTSELAQAGVQRSVGGAEGRGKLSSGMALPVWGAADARALGILLSPLLQHCVATGPGARQTGSLEKEYRSFLGIPSGNHILEEGEVDAEIGLNEVSSAPTTASTLSNECGSSGLLPLRYGLAVLLWRHSGDGGASTIIPLLNGAWNRDPKVRKLAAISAVDDENCSGFAPILFVVYSPVQGDGTSCSRGVLGAAIHRHCVFATLGEGCPSEANAAAVAAATATSTKATRGESSVGAQKAAKA